MPESPTVRVVVRQADATDDEVAAIVAAIEACWPRAAPAGAPAVDHAVRWRFSGRWWTKPVPLRRDRPTPYLH
jgi:hypothetical protein